MFRSNIEQLDLAALRELIPYYDNLVSQVRAVSEYIESSGAVKGHTLPHTEVDLNCTSVLVRPSGLFGPMPLAVDVVYRNSELDVLQVIRFYRIDCRLVCCQGGDRWDVCEDMATLIKERLNNMALKRMVSLFPKEVAE